MDRHAHVNLTCVVVLGQALIPAAIAADPPVSKPSRQIAAERPSDRPDLAVLQALRANPLTAPYMIKIAWRDGAVILSGRVGTSQIHNVAVRTVIDLGFAVKDDLVIDTAEAHRVALAQAAA